MKKLLLFVCAVLPATAGADGPDLFGGYALSRRDGEPYHGDLAVGERWAVRLQAGVVRTRDDEPPRLGGDRLAARPIGLNLPPRSWSNRGRSKTS